MSIFYSNTIFRQNKRQIMIKLSTENIDALKKIIHTSIPQLSINTVIFRFHKEELQFAVVQLVDGNTWFVPGGYVFQNESVDDAARRNLYEQTQINDLVLFQFGSFGSSDRSIGSDNNDIEQMGMPDEIHGWITQRFVTIAYYSIISDPITEIKLGPLYGSAKWLNIEDKENLAMDHSFIVAEARKALARDLLSQPLLLSFMPAKFTIPELQKLYEAILGRSVDRGNFRKRMLKSGFLIKTGQVQGNARQRPPEFYRINSENFLNSLTEDVKLGF